MLRRILLAVLLLVMIGSCAGDDWIHALTVDAFSRCVEDGGGTVPTDVDLVIVEGRALSMNGAGGNVDDSLLRKCLDAVSAARISRRSAGGPVSLSEWSPTT